MGVIRLSIMQPMIPLRMVSVVSYLLQASSLRCHIISLVATRISGELLGDLV
jgi:hypothetical protein